MYLKSKFSKRVKKKSAKDNMTHKDQVELNSIMSKTADLLNHVKNVIKRFEK